MKAQDDASEGGDGGDAPAKPEPERPEFPLEDFNLEFEAANAVIEIPEKVEDDIDNDYDLPYTAPAMGE